jgi:hypothetical protein
VWARWVFCFIIQPVDNTLKYRPAGVVASLLLTWSFSHSEQDFYPALQASHWAHIANATFTTLMIGVMAWPDWDM